MNRYYFEVYAWCEKITSFDQINEKVECDSEDSAREILKEKYPYISEDDWDLTLIKENV